MSTPRGAEPVSEQRDNVDSKAADAAWDEALVSLPRGYPPKFYFKCGYLTAHERDTRTSEPRFCVCGRSMNGETADLMAVTIRTELAWLDENTDVKLDGSPMPLSEAVALYAPVLDLLISTGRRHEF